ncbi:MAG: MG2 domain-containing protein [Flavobacteriales bacterium]
MSDIRTTAPLSGVRIDVLDLQRRSLGQATTNGEGLVTLPAGKHPPFLLIASKGTQRGYLKMDDGSALSVSEYDVGGEAVDKGLKGFLYGERGVWRPGDSLFLTFILQNVGNKLPKDYPVTLELSDPQGRLDQRIVRTAGVDGTYAFACATDADAPTGVWSARVAVGGTSFYKPLRIESVKPNRLKVQLDLGGERITASEHRRAELQSNWLHGAPARDLRARLTVSLTRSSPVFKGYKDFRFDDLHADLNTDEITVFDGKLDANGHASFPFGLSLNTHAPAAVDANIVTRVFEAGGEASTDRSEVTYYPYTSYVGMKMPDPTNSWGTYVTDTTYDALFAAIDADGKALADHALDVQLIKLSYNWWWNGDMDGPSSYMNAPSSRIVQEQKVRTDAQGRAHFGLRVLKPDWGRFVLRVSDSSSGHVSATELYVDWSGYEGRSRRQGEKEAAMLRFNSDKQNYNVGDACTLIFPSPAKGRALVSLENGTHVLATAWVELTDKETRYTFPITAEMAPNIHAHVTLLQPHAMTAPKEESTGNDLPIRLYGVIPIRVEDKATHLAPLITMAGEVRTDEPFNVQVAEQDGKAMTYTLAIVDEGLLDLTRFKTPDPWNYFYAREALGVRTWDLYDQVIGAFGRPLQSVLAIGGSDQVDPNKAAKANRFEPVVRFVGPFKLAKGKKTQHTFTISNYVGSVRVMVVANDGQRAYGNAEKTVPVRKPLMLLATLPRVVGPGETVDLPVTVFAMDPKVKNVSLKLSPNALFTVEGPATQTLTFNSTGDQVALFRVKVAERIGVGNVMLTAEGAGERATQRIELDVRQPNRPQTDVAEAVVDAGKSWEDAPKAIGVTGTNSAYLEISTIPPVDMGRRLQYLVDYPHGCVEQTTSKAFPQLFLASVMDVDARTAQAMRANVEAGLRRLKSFQQPNGAFSYWPGQSEVNDWSSIYVGHFLVEAERQGFALPVGMKDKWLAHQREAARNWTNAAPEGWRISGAQLTQAYRLYALALSGNADAGAMNRLRTQPQLSGTARWMLAAAFALNNRKDVARELVSRTPSTVTPYTEMGWTYGSDLRDEAVIAEALLRMDDKAAAAGVIKRVAEHLGSQDWYSTQSTAWGLLAVSRMAAAGELSKDISFTLTVDGKREERSSRKSVVRVDLPEPDGRHKVGITNSGKNLLYVRTVRTGTPLAGEEHAASNGLAIDVRYLTMEGKPLDPGTLEQGTELMAVVSVQHPGIREAYQELALTQVFPSGWENPQQPHGRHRKHPAEQLLPIPGHPGRPRDDLLRPGPPPERGVPGVAERRLYRPLLPATHHVQRHVR